jgi:large subunit ribosomal protein L30e
VKVDVKKQINTAIVSGNVVFGSNKTADALLYDEPKLVLLASNCPKSQREKITYYSALSGVKCVTLKENSMELGSGCGRPHHLSALAVLDAGESSILEVRE